MPAMMVWPVSSSVWTRKDGSSIWRRFSARPILSWSAFDLRLDRDEMTGSGNSIRSRMTGASSSQSVSPVVVARSPTAAAMSPA